MLSINKSVLSTRATDCTDLNSCLSPNKSGTPNPQHSGKDWTSGSSLFLMELWRHHQLLDQP